MDILITVGYVGACVLLFSLAVAIHEFGHFIVALRLGLRVERFSIGFGPALWKRTFRGVEYRISAIPLGGYVSLPDLDPEGTKRLEGAGGRAAESAGGDIVRSPIPPWKQILVSVAGPVMNLVLAVVLAVILSLVPSARFGELPTVIGGLVPDGPAERAGLRVGDRVLAVGGRPVGTWTDLQTEVQISGGRPTVFLLEGADVARREVTVSAKRNGVTGAYLIEAVSVTNESGAVAWMPARSPWQQLAWDAGSIFRVLKGLVTPREAKATAGALGGPVMIAEGIYRSLRRDAWDGVGFLRFLNVNLAVLNLLPIPVLDGGLVLFALLAILFRRPVPEKVVTALSMAFMWLLFGLMGILILKDSWRSYRIHTCGTPAAVETDAVPAATGGAHGDAK